MGREARAEGKVGREAGGRVSGEGGVGGRLSGEEDGREGKWGGREVEG